MTARREVDLRLRSLGEIREVLNSMKTLAYMEMRKIARFLEPQQRQVADIELMAADLLAHFPSIRGNPAPLQVRTVLIGAERGLCGDFNEALAQYPADSTGAAPLIAVGQRLGVRMSEQSPATLVIDGASATEQVGRVRDDLVAAISDLQSRTGPVGITLVSHGAGDRGLQRRRLVPPFEELPVAVPARGLAPELNVPPTEMFTALMDQYLFAAVAEALYASLLAENQRRMQHLDAAIRHLDERRDNLARQSRSLRQEEIIEEIEVILLNVSSRHDQTHGASLLHPSG